jgi:hypothetical protein
MSTIGLTGTNSDGLREIDALRCLRQELGSTFASSNWLNSSRVVRTEIMHGRTVRPVLESMVVTKPFECYYIDLVMFVGSKDLMEASQCNLRNDIRI